MKRILIVGMHSYIGRSLRAYLEQYGDKYIVGEIAAKGLVPTADIFRGANVVFCAAGIAHVKETPKNRHLYYDINRDLVTAVAKASREAGVKQFILLSSMSVYGLRVGHIRKDTEPRPVTAYGESKLQADEEIRKLESDGFRFACLRAPMVYGPGCRGNYQALREFALRSPVFPDYENQRSMVYIGNLCEFVRECIDLERHGVFFPQNAEYVSTSRMVELIAQAHGKKVRLTKAFNAVLEAAPFALVKKVFGSLTYEHADTVGKYGFEESIELTEE